MPSSAVLSPAHITHPGRGFLQDGARRGIGVGNLCFREKGSLPWRRDFEPVPQPLRTRLSFQISLDLTSHDVPMCRPPLL